MLCVRSVAGKGDAWRGLRAHPHGALPWQGLYNPAEELMEAAEAVPGVASVREQTGWAPPNAAWLSIAGRCLPFLAHAEGPSTLPPDPCYTLPDVTV